jgi:hypothetical protein
VIGIKVFRGYRVLAIFAGLSATVSALAWAHLSNTAGLAPTAVLKVNTSDPGHVFDIGAVGLSMEAHELSTGRLAARHSRLVQLMRLLGPSVLRIGGDSVDFSWWTSRGEPAPAWATSVITPADLAALHELLTATGWRALLGVDFGHFDPTRAADEARYAREILGTGLLGVEIGNEPNAYGHEQNALRPPTYSFGEYLGEADVYRQALAGSGVAVYGPALTRKTPWLAQMGASAGMFTEFTQHYYPINTCPTTAPSSPRPTALELLSPVVREEEDGLLGALVNVAAAAGRPVRIGETNSVACRASLAASPAFAGALWSLDWVLRAASSGVTGLNFHGGLGGCAANSESPICTPENEAAAGAREQAEYYGLLAARRLEGGRFVPTRLIAPGPPPNITTWATIAPNRVIRIAIDDFATTGLAQPVAIAIPGYTATDEVLIAPSAGANKGVTLGGAAVTGTGQWRPTPATPSHTHRSIRVVVHPASAVIVTLSPRRSRR